MNPAEHIDKSTRLSKLQLINIFICFLMNMLDGMDVMVISYTAPGIAKQWSVSPEALGVVFSSGLVGMTVGAILLAPYADKIGRKAMMLISAVIMGSTIYATSFSGSVNMLMVCRFISGMGIGAMLASTAALTAEYTPSKTKDFWVSLVISGYPVGAVLSGLVAASIIPAYGWQSMFRFAGITSLIAVPLIYFFLTESLAFYLKQQPAAALAKANKILSRLGTQQITQLPQKTEAKQTVSVRAVLNKTYKQPTIQLWIALFLAFATLYFLTNWIPKLVSNAGLSVELSIYTGAVFNGGAFIGIVTQGYFSSRFGLKKTIGWFLILTAVLMAVFKIFIGSDILLLVFGLLGFGLQGGFVGLYAVAARMYPTEFRTTGVGWAIGIGRLGGIIGPVAGGLLIGLGLSMAANFLWFAIPTVFAGIITMRISSKEIS